MAKIKPEETTRARPTLDTVGHFTGGGGGSSGPGTNQKPSTSTSKANAATEFALSKVGDPYGWGAEGQTRGSDYGDPGYANGTPYVDQGKPHYDCSGLTQAAYASVGVSIGRTTYLQAYQGTQIDKDDMSKWLVGDLIFPDPGHVQMYCGNGYIVEAPHTGAFVQYVKEWSNEQYMVRRIVGGGSKSVSPGKTPSGGAGSSNGFTGSGKCALHVFNVCLMQDSWLHSILGGLTIAAGVIVMATGAVLMAKSNPTVKNAVKHTAEIAAFA